MGKILLCSPYLLGRVRVSITSACCLQVLEEAAGGETPADGAAVKAAAAMDTDLSPPAKRIAHTVPGSSRQACCVCQAASISSLHLQSILQQYPLMAEKSILRACYMQQSACLVVQRGASCTKLSE